MTDGSPEMSTSGPDGAVHRASESNPRVDLAADQRLLELAAPRPEPLFAVLRRSAMLRPLLLLGATLPGLLALAWRRATGNPVPASR